MKKTEIDLQIQKTDSGCVRGGGFRDWMKEVKGFKVKIDSYKIIMEM